MGKMLEPIRFHHDGTLPQNGIKYSELPKYVH